VLNSSTHKLCGISGVAFSMQVMHSEDFLCLCPRTFINSYFIHNCLHVYIIQEILVDDTEAVIYDEVIIQCVRVYVLQG